MVSTPALRKSERTRRAILDSARSHFAARGFDGANLRAISADAAIDPAMVLRYFGSKEGLFAAAVPVDLHLPLLSEVPADGRGRVLAAHFIRLWEGEPDDDVLVLLLRSAVTNAKVADQLRSIFTGQVVAALRPVIAEAELLRRAALVSSQLLGIALTRYILVLPGSADTSAEQLVADLAPTLQRYLDGQLEQV